RLNKVLELEEIDKLESMDLMQKARLKWVVEGDENSKIFHSIINSKRKSNRILNEGVSIADPNDINTVFLNFYKEKFSCLDSSMSFPPVLVTKRLGDSDRSYLDSMVSLEEIKDVVWDSGSQKAPGRDAWSKARDPLSPFLFIMVMEGLNIMLKDGLAANLFCGVKIGSPCFHLSHLFYADDVIIFSKRNQCDMDNIIRILDVFYLASSLKININKSNLYGVGVSSEDVT
nr:RNA-directed DNA polymerase, eukaryota, reverse transcriptase zinc-binding domain protein [Tanacetum cinerariifolium]